jgi:hypothetical protein
MLLFVDLLNADHIDAEVSACFGLYPVLDTNYCISFWMYAILNKYGDWSLHSSYIGKFLNFSIWLLMCFFSSYAKLLWEVAEFNESD